MRVFASASILAVFFVVGAVPAAAQNDPTQLVSYEVKPINVINVSGDPGPLVIDNATAGSQPDSDTDASTTYGITTNETPKKITAALDSDMPLELTLTVELQAPTGATSAGAVTLSAGAVDAVTGIGRGAESGLAITYVLTATANAQPQSGTRTATFTILDDI